MRKGQKKLTFIHFLCRHACMQKKVGVYVCVYLNPPGTQNWELGRIPVISKGSLFPGPCASGRAVQLKDWKKENPVIKGVGKDTFYFPASVEVYQVASGTRLRTQCCIPVTASNFIPSKDHLKQVMFYPSLTDKDREVQRHWVICPEPWRTAVASDWYQGSIYQVWCLTSDREHSLGSSQWVQASASHQIWQPVFYCYNKISNIQQIIKSVFALQCLRLGRERWCQHLLRAFLLPHGGRGHDRTAESVPAQCLLSLATKPLTPP